jgi:hypothetical protein
VTDEERRGGEERRRGEEERRGDTRDELERDTRWGAAMN